MSNRYPKKLKNCNKCKMNNYNNTANLKICTSSPRKNCNNKNLKKKKHFKYDVFYDCESHIQVVQMQLRSARGNFSFILTGEACIDDGKNKFIDCKEQNIYLDEDIREFFFDDGIKKSFWKNLKESILLEPNFNGIGIDLKKLFQK